MDETKAKQALTLLTEALAAPSAPVAAVRWWRDRNPVVRPGTPLADLSDANEPAIKHYLANGLRADGTLGVSPLELELRLQLADALDAPDITADKAESLLQRSTLFGTDVAVACLLGGWVQNFGTPFIAPSIFLADFLRGCTVAQLARYGNKTPQPGDPGPSGQPA